MEEPMLLFLDESGSDHRAMPYEVNGGIAIDESRLWSFICAVGEVQDAPFGGRLRALAPHHEFKAKNLLATDKFRFAEQGPPMDDTQRRGRARGFLLQSSSDRCRPRRSDFTAYGQACLTYVRELLSLCAEYDVKVFAAISDPETLTRMDTLSLRSDLAVMFERYGEHVLQRAGSVEDPVQSDIGFVVFDELERGQCRRLLHQMENFFLRTRRGRALRHTIIPEAFFVHSDLTTGTQVADIVIYILNWAYRSDRLNKPLRRELAPYAAQIEPLIARSWLHGDGKPRCLWSSIHCAGEDEE